MLEVNSKDLNPIICEQKSPTKKELQPLHHLFIPTVQNSGASVDKKFPRTSFDPSPIDSTPKERSLLSLGGEILIFMGIVVGIASNHLLPGILGVTTGVATLSYVFQRTLSKNKSLKPLQKSQI